MTHLTVVGSINTDIVAALSRLPTAGETVGCGKLSRTHGGKGANQAVAASRLGATVRMIGAVGADPDGASALDNLRMAGVSTEHVKVVDAPTGTALIAVDGSAENQIALCEGANEFLVCDPAQLSGPVLTQLEIPIAQVLELAKLPLTYLAVNTAPALPIPQALLDRVDLFIANEEEYQLLPELAEAKLVAVTLGAAGARLYSHGQQIAAAISPSVEALNTVGAGDVFCAALTLGLLAGVDPYAALAAACAAGADAVRHAEAQPPLRPLSSYLSNTA